MFINARSASDLRRSIRGRKHIETGSTHTHDINLSLAATLDLVLFSLGSNEESKDTATWLDGLKSPFIRQVRNALQTNADYRSNLPFAARKLEVFPIRRLADVQTNEWVLFRARFAKAAGGGRKGNLYHGVSSVLAEMGDNVAWHAPISREQGCLGIAAYHVSRNIACFSVADDGRGFLTSLRTNAKWSHLLTEREALESVLFRHATSRIGEETGAGFTVLYNKLLSVNGSVLIRSGGCTAALRSNVGVNNSVVFREGENTPGAQVTVIVAKTGLPVEIPLEEIP